LTSNKKKNKETLTEEEKYYLSKEGLTILAASFLLNRGFCCDSGCKNCPYPTK
tara:strand:- start:713 stop:871 length:159 start_codon:yes stop_codon:yes gene_type:complete